MRTKIEKVLKLLAEIREERIEAFMDCNECSYEEAGQCEEVENIDIAINYLEELL